jgi:hypothetical protein
MCPTGKTTIRRRNAPSGNQTRSTTPELPHRAAHSGKHGSMHAAYKTGAFASALAAGMIVAAASTAGAIGASGRLDTVEFDELLAADSFDGADEDLMRRFRELIPDDFAEGLRLAVAEAERNREDHPVE